LPCRTRATGLWEDVQDAHGLSGSRTGHLAARLTTSCRAYATGPLLRVRPHLHAPSATPAGPPDRVDRGGVVRQQHHRPPPRRCALGCCAGASLGSYAKSLRYHQHPATVASVRAGVYALATMGAQHAEAHQQIPAVRTLACTRHACQCQYLDNAGSIGRLETRTAGGASLWDASTARRT
jgi:hypothetical protein